MGFPKTQSHYRRQIKRLLFGRLKANFFFPSSSPFSAPLGARPGGKE